MDRAKAAGERRIEQLAIEIEGQIGNAFAADYPRLMITQSPGDDQLTIRKLAAEVDARRRACRDCFSSWAPRRQ